MQLTSWCKIHLQVTIPQCMIHHGVAVPRCIIHRWADFCPVFLQSFGKNQNCHSIPLMSPGGAIWFLKSNTKKSRDTVPLTSLSAATVKQNAEAYIRVRTWNRLGLQIAKCLIYFTKDLSWPYPTGNLLENTANIVSAELLAPWRREIYQGFKETVLRGFWSWYYHQTASSGPIRGTWWQFRFWSIFTSRNYSKNLTS